MKLLDRLRDNRRRDAKFAKMRREGWLLMPTSPDTAALIRDIRQKTGEAEPDAIVKSALTAYLAE